MKPVHSILRSAAHIMRNSKPALLSLNHFCFSVLPPHSLLHFAQGSLPQPLSLFALELHEPQSLSLLSTFFFPRHCIFGLFWKGTVSKNKNGFRTQCSFLFSSSFFMFAPPFFWGVTKTSQPPTSQHSQNIPTATTVFPCTEHPLQSVCILVFIYTAILKQQISSEGCLVRCR